MSQPSYEFRTVVRGFEPTEVERALQQLWAKVEQGQEAVAQAEADNEGLRQQLGALSDQSHIDQVQIRQLVDELEQAEAPSASAITERAAKILKLAEEEAGEILSKAKSAAIIAKADADRYGEQTRKAADLDAAETADKAKSQSARLLEEADQKADEVLDNANMEATTRREEAEAIFERQRSRAAAAAAEFEKTLTTRRDAAAKDFASQMESYQQAISAAEQRHVEIRAESDQMLATAKQDTEMMLRSAREEAAQKLDDARLAADRVRTESERELLAATARREAVTAQLTNVRQMIAALGTGTLLDGMVIDDDDDATADQVTEAAEALSNDESSGDGSDYAVAESAAS